jgi:hypothetical protein
LEPLDTGAFSCADRIKKRFEGNPMPLAKAQETIERAILNHFKTALESDGVFGLVIGFRDVDGNSALWRSLGTKLVPIKDFWCDESGHVLATAICRSLFPHGMSVAVAHHLVTQVMREGRKAAYVGGDIHTWSVRNNLDGQGYFPISNGNRMYLWGTQQMLFSAIRDSLNGHAMRRDAALQALTVQVQDLALFMAAPHSSQGVSLHSIDPTEDSPHLMP